MRKRLPKRRDSRLMWIRLGDHRLEAERLMNKNKRENGRLTGDPDVITRNAPKGLFTVLSADAEWWSEEMRLHLDWGRPIKDDGTKFDALDDYTKGSGAA